MPAMSSEHVMVGPIENAVSGRHALLRFRLNSETHWTNRRVARHPPAVPNQAERVTFATTDHFIISLMPPVKNITIYGLNHSPLVRSSFKISFNTVKIQLIHSAPCATFFQIVSLTFSFFRLFKNFNYYIYLKNMYIKRLFSSNKIEEPFTFPQTS